ncbi:hypothetical protein CVS47_00896 [Microbacterium lemovicicum]|uniref:DUF2255 domain-containing protein n=2 Tax=Microbacterium lemovicicum TaxID=1072463 RepID=A0A3Q9IXK4_9MICO|nr:hypothetical protein CVS47_00896 [Microbacterium lemovicicum]
MNRSPLQRIESLHVNGEQRPARQKNGLMTSGEKPSAPDSVAWCADDLQRISDTLELPISMGRADSSASDWTPIWVVVAGEHVFVRTWHRRTTGWYGRAVARRRARVLLSADIIDVSVTPVGDHDAAAIDTAYRYKYGLGAASMVTDESRASTLRLSRLDTAGSPDEG